MSSTESEEKDEALNERYNKMAKDVLEGIERYKEATRELLEEIEQYEKAQAKMEEARRQEKTRQEALAKKWTPDLEDGIREELLEVCPSLERLPFLMQSLLHCAKTCVSAYREEPPYRSIQEYLDLAELELKLQKMGR